MYLCIKKRPLNTLYLIHNTTMKLFNSYSDKVEQFKPLKSEEVKLYVCGITPYDTTHLGHAFVYVTFDALKRFLEFKGYKVIYTQNVTDIDDDILKRAKSEGKNWKQLGDFWTEKFLRDLKNLNVKMPDNYIKATDAITEIVKIIQKLLNKGFAYEKDGNVYFEVDKFPDFGNLSKLSAPEMVGLLKERGGDPDDPNKKAPLDFVLWQKSKKGEPFWNSPFGSGRPGWHIECSAMVKKTLGDQIDIHGGGLDLIYPHHESEIAQSESYSGKSPFVKNWMHIAMVSYQGEKMSKSLGNLVLVSDLLNKYSPNATRLMLLLNHYGKPWEYTENQIKDAQKIIEGLEESFRIIKSHTDGLDEFLSDLENNFDTKSAINRLIKESDINPEKSKAGFELLGFKFN